MEVRSEFIEEIFLGDALIIILLQSLIDPTDHRQAKDAAQGLNLKIAAASRSSLGTVLTDW